MAHYIDNKDVKIKGTGIQFDVSNQDLLLSSASLAGDTATITITEQGGVFTFLLPTGVSFDVSINGTPHLTIDETEITPAVPFANIETTGLLEQSVETKASATNLGVPIANFIKITGTTTLATMAVTNLQEGTEITMRFGNAITVNHSGVSGGFALAGSGNTAFAAGDRVKFVLFNDGANSYWLQVGQKVSN